MRTFGHSCRQRGLGVVEIMVAVTIGLMLLAGVYALFISSHRTQLVEHSVATLQDSDRFIQMHLSEAIRMAGASGCGSLARKSVHVDADNLGPWKGQSVYGLNNVGPGNEFGARPGTDVLQVFEISPSAFPVSNNSNNSSNTANLKVAVDAGQANAWHQGQDLIVTDCHDADIFALTNQARINPSSGLATLTHAANLNRDPKLKYAYGSNAIVGRFNEESYFVKANPNGSGGAPVTYGLYEENDGKQSLLVDHVSNMQVQYGVDTTPNDGVDNVGQYVSANQVSDWNLVRAVRIEVVLRSKNLNLASSAQAYPLGMDPRDKRLKLLLSDVVAIRNANS